MAKRLEAAGFSIEAILGDYQGGPWDERADVWVILARKAGTGRGKRRLRLSSSNRSSSYQR